MKTCNQCKKICPQQARFCRRCGSQNFYIGSSPWVWPGLKRFFISPFSFLGKLRIAGSQTSPLHQLEDQYRKWAYEVQGRVALLAQMAAYIEVMRQHGAPAEQVEKVEKQYQEALDKIRLVQERLAAVKADIEQAKRDETLRNATSGLERLCQG